MLENLSLFENQMEGQVPFDLEKLNNLKKWIFLIINSVV
jgi:hypothetical protein